MILHSTSLFASSTEDKRSDSGASSTEDKRSDSGWEDRYREIVQRRKLVDLAKAREVAVLYAEVQHLDMRTCCAGRTLGGAVGGCV